MNETVRSLLDFYPFMTGETYKKLKVGVNTKLTTSVYVKQEEKSGNEASFLGRSRLQLLPHQRRPDTVDLCSLTLTLGESRYVQT